MAGVSCAPALIALDWGTSSLRGFLMDGAGAVLEQRGSGHGIVNLPEPGVPGFEAAFAAMCGAWLDRFPALPVVAGGMVGSAQGWREAAYADCPADARRLAAGAAEVGTARGVRILIAPGLVCRAPGAAPDVMRGEEIQIAGALLAHPGLAARSLLVMPGTHSKWVVVEDGRIIRFATYMTGELFAVLCRHSLLGRLMTEEAATPEAAEAAFARGIAMARDSVPGDLAHQIFAARSLGLTGELPAAALRDFLSALLIGHEVVSGTRRAASEGAPLALVGEDALCRRYGAALQQFGTPPAVQLGNTAPAGLFHFAIAAGLVAPPAPGAQETLP
ncbi:2-dehydro-3-deoxygalactonokinase [Roseomonas sp. M0104]|uniref:2-dehydro-3-deoxygalactonokinase n=1 Tax=Teichococcus coralli TaxID=2545983 RepID=A0A845BA16_9PROT|nr:2-dehydro-3-deoxygalactonokinase [Pseudoroseomonas coralli]MXP64011.1 2-dehydro-3-deoxygalactonokinase [Pseudoroseomonas coralli]